MEDGSGYVSEDWDSSGLALRRDQGRSRARCPRRERRPVRDDMSLRDGLRHVAAHALRPHCQRVHARRVRQWRARGLRRAVLATVHPRPRCRTRDRDRPRGAGRRVRGAVFNVGNTSENYRKQDLVELLLERLPETRVERVPQADDPRDYRVSFEKIPWATRRAEPSQTDSTR